MHIDPRDYHFKTATRDPSNYQFAQYRAGVRATQHRRTAIDVGAHIGIFSTRYAQDFKRVIAIEPVNVEYLRHNTQRYDNVEVYHRAVSNRVGDVVYLHNPSHNYNNSGAWEITTTPTDISENKIKDLIPITTITVDSLNLTDVDLIKIDTQGVEQQVIEGARDTITNCKPVIHIESRDDELIQWICGTFNYVVQTTVIKDRILIANKKQ